MIFSPRARRQIHCMLGCSPLRRSCTCLCVHARHAIVFRNCGASPRLVCGPLLTPDLKEGEEKEEEVNSNGNKRGYSQLGLRTALVAGACTAIDPGAGDGGGGGGGKRFGKPKNRLSYHQTRWRKIERWWRKGVRKWPRSKHRKRSRDKRT